MIEKILERLEEEYNKWVDIYNLDSCKGHTNRYADGKSCAFDEAISIVQEVVKEYGEKKYYRIVLSCLEDSTSLEMPLTKQEYLLLTRISDLVYRVAIGCMPTMYVEQKGE